jgi:hypothetical protein
LGSASTKVLPTDRTGECVISIEFAPVADVLGGYEATTLSASASYSVKDVYLSCEALSFSDDTYYNSIGDKDLRIGFNDYIYTSFPSVAKNTGINVNTYIFAGSIDHIVGTARFPQASLPSTMIANKAVDGAGSTAISFANYSSNPVGNTSEGDGFYSLKI